MIRELYLSILNHAKKEYPKESCGVIVISNGAQVYIPCTNVATSNYEFEISHEDLEAIEEQYGEYVKIVHSHPHHPCRPSEEDNQGMEATKVPWVIINPKTGEIGEFSYSYSPPPLIGREFKFGSQDCYSIVRDYFYITHGIQLINPRRIDKFWEHGRSYYMEYYEAAGFERVKDLQVGDVILMQINSSIPNHAGVYLGNGRFIQHIQGQLSNEYEYIGLWQKTTLGFYRYKGLHNENS
jgi:proteasome lid subunit RPN8/RPN11